MNMKNRRLNKDAYSKQLRYTGNRLFLAQLLPSRAVFRFIDAIQRFNNQSKQTKKVINFEYE